MSKALPADRSWPSLPDLDLIASQTRLIIRNSCKFTAAGFLQSLLSSVAMRSDPKVSAARRAERRKKARECCKNPCPKGLLRDGWHLMLTHLSREQTNVNQLAAIYRARWAVEIQFRASKQALNLDKALNRKSNEHHLQAQCWQG